MVEIKDISEMLKSLIDLYDFSKNTLSRYLKISVSQIESIMQGNVNCLPDNNSFRHQIITKISFLYFGAVEDKDLKLSAFLEVLISYHGLSKGTIAKMADVKISDIDRLLSTPPEEVEIETKYKIAIAVMGLRFFLKDCEPSV